MQTFSRSSTGHRFDSQHSTPRSGHYELALGVQCGEARLRTSDIQLGRLVVRDFLCATGDSASDGVLATYFPGAAVAGLVAAWPSAASSYLCFAETSARGANDCYESTSRQPGQPKLRVVDVEHLDP
jgi:hypothetical protein